MPNYLQFSKQGRVRSYSATSEYQSDWVFIQFEIGEVDGRTGNPPIVEPGSGYYLFRNTSVDSVYGSIYFPHAIDVDGDFRPAVQWTKTSSASGDVLWQLQYRIVRPGEVLGSFGSPVFAEPVEDYQNDDTSGKYAIDFFPLEDLDEGQTAPSNILGEVVNFILTRKSDDASDTYAANARLLHFGLYCQMNTIGSEEILTK